MSKKDEKIRKAFETKNWHEIKTQDSWQIFKIMAEFVEGFDKMAKIGPCVSIFGSARTQPENKYYQLAGGNCLPADPKRLWSDHWRWTGYHGSR